VSVIAPPYVKTPMTDKNDFSMPFMVTSEDFAALVIKQLAEDEAIISPFNPLFLAAWLVHSIHPSLLSIFFKRSPARSRSAKPTSGSKKD